MPDSSPSCLFTYRISSRKQQMVDLQGLEGLSHFPLPHYFLPFHFPESLNRLSLHPASFSFSHPPASLPISTPFQLSLLSTQPASLCSFLTDLAQVCSAEPVRFWGGHLTFPRIPFSILCPPFSKPHSSSFPAAFSPSHDQQTNLLHAIPSSTTFISSFIVHLSHKTACLILDLPLLSSE